MDRIDDFDVTPTGEADKGSAYLIEPITKAFAPMGGNDD
jgi:hypothetical protein